MTHFYQCVCILSLIFFRSFGAIAQPLISQLFRAGTAQYSNVAVPPSQFWSQGGQNHTWDMRNATTTYGTGYNVSISDQPASSHLYGSVQYNNPDTWVQWRRTSDNKPTAHYFIKAMTGRFAYCASFTDSVTQGRWMRYQPKRPVTTFPMPLTYGYADSSGYDTTITIDFLFGDTLSRRKTITRYYLSVDGWGTLLLPQGSFSVLRTMERSVFTTITEQWTAPGVWRPMGTSRLYDSPTYRWYAPNQASFMAELRNLALNMLINTASVTAAKPVHKDVETMYCYPSPATGQLFVARLKQAVPYQVFGATGQVWQSGIVNALQALDISSLPPGSYALKLPEHTLRFVKE